MQLDYLKLPFEVHYSGEVPVFQLEFKSDIDVRSLSDIKVVQKSQGNSNNPSFVCNSNSGAELYCCIKNGHDQVDTEWLDILAEDEINIDYMANLKVVA
jgi:hypothetical protein